MMQEGGQRHDDDDGPPSYHEEELDFRELFRRNARPTNGPKIVVKALPETREMFIVGMYQRFKGMPDLDAEERRYGGDSASGPFIKMGQKPVYFKVNRDGSPCWHDGHLVTIFFKDEKEHNSYSNGRTWYGKKKDRTYYTTSRQRWCIIADPREDEIVATFSGEDMQTPDCPLDITSIWEGNGGRVNVCWQ